MCDQCAANKEQLDRIEASVSLIVNTVTETINSLSAHPMFKMMLKQAGL